MNRSHERPLVSIGLPVYNEELHLREALDSLLAQDYGNVEVVISDNASTDGTPAICEEYARRDPRVRYHRAAANVGGIRNFNRVFELSRGEFFMWAAGHDVRHPAQVSACVEVLLADPAVVLCYSPVVWLGQDGRPLERVHEYLDTRSLAEWYSRLNFVLWGLHAGFLVYGVFRSDALRRTSVYTEVVSPDVSLLVELSMIGRFAYIPEPPFYVRRPEDYGDWGIYLKKHFGGQLSGWGAQRLYWRMTAQLARRVARHARSLPARAAAAAFVAAGMLVKFRWMLTGLRSVKKSRGD
jgi:glycosyltransferase involved in cell wall biosynthesis